MTCQGCQGIAERFRPEMAFIERDLPDGLEPRGYMGRQQADQGQTDDKAPSGWQHQAAPWI